MRRATIGVALMFLAAGVHAQERAVEPDTTGVKLMACAPRSYEQAIRCLDDNLSDQTKAELTAKDGLVMAHFGLGSWMRNNWGLWQGGPLAQDMRKRGKIIADDMSGAILGGFVAHLKAAPEASAR